MEYLHFFRLFLGFFCDCANLHFLNIDEEVTARSLIRDSNTRVLK